MKNYPFFISTLVPLALSGCMTTTNSVNNILSETPQPALTNLTYAVQCVGNNLNSKWSELASQSVLLAVRDFDDGTLPASARNVINGPLADASKYDFIGIITRSVYKSIIKIPYNYPPALQNINFSGVPLSEGVVELNKVFGVNSVFIVNGIFTQFDTTKDKQYGLGTTAGVRGTDTGELKFGVANSESSISLAVQLINPRNVVAAATTLTLSTSSSENEYTLSFGVGEGYGSLGTRKVTIEGTHAAQRTLTEAAAIWVLGQLYEKEADISSCMNGVKSSPVQIAKYTTDWDDMSQEGKVRAIQTLLHKGGYLEESLISGTLSEETLSAIRKFESDHKIQFPHGENLFGRLFLVLKYNYGDDKNNSPITQ